MSKNVFGKLFLLVSLAAILVTVTGCGSSSDKDAVGLISNQTPYRAQVNFVGTKIVEVPVGAVLTEYEMKKGSSYELQVTLFDGTDALQVIDSLLYIPSDPGISWEDDRRYHWIVTISGDEIPCRVTSVAVE